MDYVNKTPYEIMATGTVKVGNGPSTGSTVAATAAGVIYQDYEAPLGETVYNTTSRGSKIVNKMLKINKNILYPDGNDANVPITQIYHVYVMGYVNYPTANATNVGWVTCSAKAWFKDF